MITKTLYKNSNEKKEKDGKQHESEDNKCMLSFNTRAGSGNLTNGFYHRALDFEYKYSKPD